MSDKIELDIWLQINIEKLDEKIQKFTIDRDVLKELQRISWKQ